MTVLGSEHLSHDFGPDNINQSLSHDTHNNNQSLSGHHVEHDIHVASWKFEYVQQPFIITVFIIAIGVFKIGKIR